MSMASRMMREVVLLPIRRYPPLDMPGEFPALCSFTGIWEST
jgi:hypothetical protein